MSDVVVVGSINMDVVVQVPRLPAPGETLSGRGPAQIPGGKGANQAVAAARLGVSVAMIGSVGSDEYGAILREGLQRNGVDVSGVATAADCSSGLAFILVEAGGQNMIVILSGANGRLEPEDVGRSEERIARAKLLIAQFELRLPTVEFALDTARRHRVPVILNPAPAVPLAQALPCLERTDYLVLNETELETLSGMAAGTPADQEAAARKLLALGPRSVVVTLGADGALLVEPETSQRLPAHRVEAVDATAAGDAFIGALAAALLEGRTTRESVEFANRAGALAVTRPGAQPSLPTYQEVAAFEAPLAALPG